MPKLSVVVIGYNMARELPRTIRSLSPATQRDIDPGDYEVILIDNGSTQTFDEDELRRLLPGLVVHRLQNATVSPGRAINFGLSVARGDLVGVCIDGARIASPGLLSKALAASRLHERPVIGTIAFHLGPEVQTESVKHGYSQAVEDELLARSGWEADGYRLFTISAFALFVERRVVRAAVREHRALPPRRALACARRLGRGFCDAWWRPRQSRHLGAGMR